MAHHHPATHRALALALLIAAPLGGGLPAARADNGGASMSGPARFGPQDGAELYRSICQGCHMPEAQGATGAGAYPALAHNPRLAAAAYPVYTVIQGRKGMPPLAPYLSDAQVVAVVSYVRTHFGNHYTDVVPPSLAAAARNAGPGAR
jgi:mono/diheme cytochrome c family protein